MTLWSARTAVGSDGRRVWGVAAAQIGSAARKDVMARSKCKNAVGRAVALGAFRWNPPPSNNNQIDQKGVDKVSTDAYLGCISRH